MTSPTSGAGSAPDLPDYPPTTRPSQSGMMTSSATQDRQEAPADQVVAAGLDDVRAEHARGAVEVARVQVEQRGESVVLVLKLQAPGEAAV